MLFLLLALLLSQITGKSHELIKVTPTNLQRLLRHHPMLLIYVYSAEHGPSAILKEDLEHTMRLFAFEHSQIELAELEVSSFGDSLPNFATKAAIPLVSLHLNGRHHIYSKEKLQVIWD
jgi:hypothetical protein